MGEISESILPVRLKMKPLTYYFTLSESPEGSGGRHDVLGGVYQCYITLCEVRRVIKMPFWGYTIYGRPHEYVIP